MTTKSNGYIITSEGSSVPRRNTMRSGCVSIIIWRFRILMFLALLGTIWFGIPLWFYDRGISLGYFLWILTGVVLTSISGYFLVIQPIQDNRRRKRDEPLFRLRCVLFGHKWMRMDLSDDTEVIWCGRCGNIHDDDRQDEMKPSADVDVEPYEEKEQEIFARDMEREWEKENFCSRCGNLNSVRMTKDYKIVIYCSRCDE